MEKSSAGVEARQSTFAKPYRDGVLVGMEGVGGGVTGANGENGPREMAMGYFRCRRADGKGPTKV